MPKPQYVEQSLEIEILGKAKPNQQRYKSAVQMTLMGFVICMSAMMFGYGLTQISTIPIHTLVKQYHINFGSGLAQGLLIGIMPFGGIFGALLFKFVLKHLKRRTSIFFIACWMVASVGLNQITTVQTLFIGRFSEGICIALYVSIGPIYLREIVAKELRPQLTSIFSLCKVVGIVLAYSLEDIMIAANYNTYSWRILLGFNGVLAITQAILVYFFLPDSPLEMVQDSNIPDAERIILKLYKSQFKEDVLQQLRKESQLVKATQTLSKGQQTTTVDIYRDNKKRALWMGIHITTFRQLIGGNVLVTFSTQIIEVFTGETSPAIYTGLIVNCIQLATNGISLFTISKAFGKRPIFLIGSIGLTILNFGIAISLLLEVQISIIVMMCLYMAVYGFTFLPVSWSYPSEIITPDQAVYANVFGWIATSIVISVPPIIQSSLPSHNIYPLFFFFGAYGIFGTTYLFIKLVEVKGKTYNQIVKEY